MLEEPEELARVNSAFSHVSASALPEDESVAFLRTLLADQESESDDDQ